MESGPYADFSINNFNNILYKMASIGIVNAEIPNTITSLETTNRPKKLFFGVFFDGTGNNMIQTETAKKFRASQQLNNKDNDWDLKINKNLNAFGGNDLQIKAVKNKSAELLSDDEILDVSTKGSGYSNVAILHSVYQGMSDEQYKKETDTCDIYRYNIYVEGAGTDSTNDESHILGSGFGNGETGVVALVSKAVMMVANVVKGFAQIQLELHFDIFGFSRGATCARLFAFFVVRDNEQIGCESKFKKFQAASLCSNGKLHFLEESYIKKQVDFLGIYDTVSSIGITYHNNVKDYGLYSPALSKVKNTFHICALDEFREHFALTDIGDATNGNNLEMFIPGCHSDIGGTYTLSDEKFSLIFMPGILQRTRMYVESPHSHKGKKEELNVNTLQRLGWINSEDETFTNYTNGYIDCHRKKILGGYSNIPLWMMVKRVKRKTSLDKFSSFPTRRFDIPNKLSQLGEEMTSMAESESGRVWYYPGGSYSSSQYSYLRNSFLHFSASDALFSKKTAAVHAPSRNGNDICRIVYYGNPRTSKPNYMCDYE